MEELKHFRVRTVRAGVSGKSPTNTIQALVDGNISIEGANVYRTKDGGGMN
jgi:hypothetical protein